MDFQATIDFFTKEIKTIFQAPAIFATASVIIITVTWATINYFYSIRIENLEGRIKLKDDQILDYKDKLSGATPSEAKRRIEALEIQIKALLPRRLADEQKRIIINTLKGNIGNISIAQDMAVADAKALAADVAVAFQYAGWKVTLPSFMGLGNPPPSGIGLRVRDTNALRPLEQAARTALEAAGVDFDLQDGLRTTPQMSQRPPGYPAVPQILDPDVEIVLTTRSK